MAHAEGWNIGSNMGFGVLSPKETGDKFLLFAIPSSQGPATLTLQPGFRLGTTFASGQREGYLDLGFNVFNRSGGETATSYQVSANLQLNGSSNKPTSTFTNFGVGVAGQSFSDGGRSTNPIIGGGIGVRNRVAEGHGALRGELRYDYIFEDAEGFIGGWFLGLKFGFDLYAK